MSHVVRSWNAHVLMPSALVARAIRAHRDVDIWFLQESHRRRRTLSGIPGFTLYMPVGLPGQDRQDRAAAGGSPILVRSDLDQRPLPPVRLKKRWRRRRMPGIHPPRTLTRVWVEGIEYVDGHAPEKFDAALPARIEFMGALRALFADGKPRVVGGDMNGKSFERGPGFPADVITDHRLFVGNARPARIDFFMGKGVTFSGTKAASTREGSDHHAVQTTVTPLVVQPPDPEETVLLTDLADVCRTSGLRVVELPGWQTNFSAGGFNPRGVLCHHTGAHDPEGDFTDDEQYARWLAFVGRPDLPPPLCNLALSAESIVYVCSAGNANHAGRARASGPMPAASDGNVIYGGVEAMNSGSQGWGSQGIDAHGEPVTQREGYARLCAALCRGYDWPASHVRAHRETSVTGKPDPGLLDMDDFRRDVAAEMEDEVTEKDKQDIADLVVSQLLSFGVDPLGDDEESTVRIELLQVLRQTHNRAGKTLDAVKAQRSDPGADA